MKFICSKEFIEKTSKIMDKQADTAEKNRVPLCITADMSSSMDNTMGKIKYVLMNMNNSFDT